MGQPVVVVPKPNGEVRLCVDMRANCAVERERYPIPTIDEARKDMNNSEVFSKLDLRWVYHQIELSEESPEITTFITHKGLYRYKRLMFGISSAPEKYQQVIQQTLQGIEGVHNISHDIIVHGATRDQHDERLRSDDACTRMWPYPQLRKVPILHESGDIRGRSPIKSMSRCGC